MARPPRSTTAALLLGGSLLLTACGGPPDFAGTWAPDDGSGTKAIDSSGRCRGMYYNGGTVLDIGGPMSCAFSAEKDAQGHHTLTVSQPPNERSYAVEMDGEDTMILRSLSSGESIVTLERR